MSTPRQRRGLARAVAADLRNSGSRALRRRRSQILTSRPSHVQRRVLGVSPSEAARSTRRSRNLTSLQRAQQNLQNALREVERLRAELQLHEDNDPESSSSEPDSSEAISEDSIATGSSTLSSEDDGNPMSLPIRLRQRLRRQRRNERHARNEDRRARRNREQIRQNGNNENEENIRRRHRAQHDPEDQVDDETVEEARRTQNNAELNRQHSSGRSYILRQVNHLRQADFDHLHDLIEFWGEANDIRNYREARDSFTEALLSEWNPLMAVGNRPVLLSRTKNESELQVGVWREDCAPMQAERRQMARDPTFRPAALHPRRKRGAPAFLKMMVSSLGNKLIACDSKSSFANAEIIQWSDGMNMAAARAALNTAFDRGNAKRSRNFNNENLIFLGRTRLAQWHKDCVNPEDVPSYTNVAQEPPYHKCTPLVRASTGEELIKKQVVDISVITEHGAANMLAGGGYPRGIQVDDEVQAL